ncbi:MAG: hypothetical protein AAF368_09900, partial [Planctomycetota bacterium]
FVIIAIGLGSGCLGLPLALVAFADAFHPDYKHKPKRRTASPRASKRAGKASIRMGRFVRIKHTP